MEEKNTKLMKKCVGATIGGSYSRGITLIALIITIIVMLILVGVTVNVALNGGLFNTAKEATSKTQLEIDREQLFSAVIGAIGENGELDFNKLDANLVEGFEGSKGTYTSKSGNVFTVDESGKISIAITKETLIKELQNKSVGDKYILNNVEYIVADKDESAVQLISSTPLGSVTLGVGDDTVTGENDIEIALNSYNNALNKIQSECERVVGYESLPQEAISVRAARSYIRKNSGYPYCIYTFKDMTSDKTEDLEFVENFVDTSFSDSWLACWIAGNTSNKDYLIGVSTVLDVYGSAGGFLLTRGDVWPMNNTTDGTLSIDGPLEETFIEAYTRTHGVIPIITINIK